MALLLIRAIISTCMQREAQESFAIMATPQITSRNLKFSTIHLHSTHCKCYSESTTTPNGTRMVGIAQLCPPVWVGCLLEAAEVDGREVECGG